MRTRRQQIDRKTAFDRNLTATQLINQPRAFMVQAAVEETANLSPEQADLQTQLLQAQDSGYNFAQLQVQPTTARIIQPKLTIGRPNNKYEQEADSVAQKVVQRINSPASNLAQKQTIQRQENPEEEVQTKPLADSIQRQGKEEQKEEPNALGKMTEKELIDSFEAAYEIGKEKGIEKLIKDYLVVVEDVIKRDRRIPKVQKFNAGRQAEEKAKVDINSRNFCEMVISAYNELYSKYGLDRITELGYKRPNLKVSQEIIIDRTSSLRDYLQAIGQLIQRKYGRNFEAEAEAAEKKRALESERRYGT